MFEFTNCSIYTKNGGISGKIQEKFVLQAASPTGETTLHVDCEFFLAGSCKILRRELTIHEAIKCSRYFDSCPLRTRMLKNVGR